MKKHLLFTLFLSLTVALFLCSCAPTPEPNTCDWSGTTQYVLDTDTAGVMEKVNNIVNTTIVSNDDNVYKAEYEAGFVQGKLQANVLTSTRDNLWDDSYLTNPSHTFPGQEPPSEDELMLAEQTLRTNWNYLLNYIQNETDADLARKMRRLLYRLVGIYHGATQDNPESLEFSDSWLPEFDDAEWLCGYETDSLTFADLYWINAYCDVMDVLDSLAETDLEPSQRVRTKCSAFVKKTESDIFLTHNSWCCFLAQSQAMTLWINGDCVTFNAFSPGVLASFTDFGYNNKGIIFNETTHHATYTEPKTEALWQFWRAALAEQFSGSTDDFFRYISLEPSGTYMNGYMTVDTNTNQIGLVEMSYKNFVFFKPNDEGGFDVTIDGDGTNTGYDEEMVQPDYLLGINYPASYQIREDLQAQDTRPARKQQFLEFIGDVDDIETAKELITYTDPDNPLSIYGRWDLGYGETPTPQQIPDGAIDAKATSVSMTTWIMELDGVLDYCSSNQSFWMKYGTAHVDGEPFIWSESIWPEQTLRDVPDRVDGDFVYLKAHIR